MNLGVGGCNFEMLPVRTGLVFMAIFMYSGVYLDQKGVLLATTRGSKAGSTNAELHLGCTVQ